MATPKNFETMLTTVVCLSLRGTLRHRLRGELVREHRCTPNYKGDPQKVPREHVKAGGMVL